MKFLFVFALAICAASANVLPEYQKPVPLLEAPMPPQGNGIEGRIVNGEKAKINQFPYQAGLTLRKSPTSASWCGGSLIDLSWILTAAHCTDKAQSVTIILGTILRSKPEVSIDVDYTQIFQHKDFNGQTLVNDVSLIKIPTVKTSPSIQPILIPSISSSYDSYAGNEVIASGFGRTSDTSGVSEDLNFAILKVVTNSECSSIYGTTTVNAGTICVSTKEKKGTCQGDSGGPLVDQKTGRLIGVTSFVASVGCVYGYPSGFARVTTFLNWIKSISGVSH